LQKGQINTPQAPSALPAPDSKSLADLKVGQSGTVLAIDDPYVGQKLMEMGIVPGCKLRLCNVAPLGCPICVQIDQATLTFRAEAAKHIMLA